MDGVLDGSIPAERLARLCFERQVPDLEEAESRGLWFDEQASRVVRLFCLLSDSKGEWVGLLFVPLPWQQFLLWCVFGWKRDEDYRSGRNRPQCRLVASSRNSRLDRTAGKSPSLLWKPAASSAASADRRRRHPPRVGPRLDFRYAVAFSSQLLQLQWLVLLGASSPVVGKLSDWSLLSVPKGSRGAADARSTQTARNRCSVPIHAARVGRRASWDGQDPPPTAILVVGGPPHTRPWSRASHGPVRRSVPKAALDCRGQTWRHVARRDRSRYRRQHRSAVRPATQARPAQVVPGPRPQPCRDCRLARHVRWG